MQFVYALINFLLLAGIIVLIGGKKIKAIFTGRREKINRELDEAEALEHEPPAELPCEETEDSETEAAYSGALNAIKAEAAEEKQRREQFFEHRKADLQREMVFTVRTDTVKKLQKRIAALLREESYREKLRRRLPEIVDCILEKTEITPGGVAYARRYDVLYATLSSAEEIPDELVKKIRNHIALLVEEVGGDLAFRVNVDPSLIGGVRLRIGDTVYDCTASNALYRLDRKIGRLEVNETSEEEIFEHIKTTVASMPVRPYVDIFQLGRVISISDGICWMDGFADVMFGEVVEFECGERGMVLDIQPDRVGCVIYGKYEHIESCAMARSLGTMADVPVGEELLGRVVDPVGNPIDGKGRIWTRERRPIECKAPAIPDRKSVSVPLHTGIKAIDALVPIGRGQRELIIGDRQTGKTAIAIDTIINQKGKNVACIYVAIGQKEATVAEIKEKLEKYGAMEYTTIVCATASDSASLQYIAPFAGAAMSEYFMYHHRDALIVYDDLSKHAVAYREISLLLHRPSGREAYPGDVFYLHSRLLERAARLSEEAGGGSVTALPIVETQAGDISAYIPTNVISITDGQIFLETDLFNEGQRPAVNVGLSVSRVGGAAQTKLMKSVSARLRMSLAQYRELATFAQFGSDLDEATNKVLSNGARMMAALRQGRYAPLPDWKQALLLYAISEGFASNVNPDDMEQYEEMLYTRFEGEHPELVSVLRKGEKLTDAEKDKVRAALSEISSSEEAS